MGCAIRGAGTGNGSGAAPESLWTRDALGGDWGSFRGALGQQGAVRPWATGFYQDLLQGAGNDDGGFSGRADLMINGDTASSACGRAAAYTSTNLPGRRPAGLSRRRLFPHTSGSGTADDTTSL